MRTSSLIYHFLLLCVVLASICQATEYREGYLMVRFNETGTSSTSDAARQAVVNAAGGGQIMKTYKIVPGLALVKLPAGKDVPSARAAFAATAGVQYAEPDHIMHYAAIPNDTNFGQLWGMHNTGQTGGLEDADIDAPEAWDIATGRQEVIAAICDSGIDRTHPDLVNNMWVNVVEQNGTVGVDDDNNGYVDDIYGWDFAYDDAEPEDNVEHGTHVAGTVGAQGNNGLGVAGVNWTVRLMAVKIGDTYGIAISDAIEGIEYATAMGAKVMNHSWGGYGFNQGLYDAITASQQAGVLFVAAAGNSYNDNDVLPAYPASYDQDNIVSVLATDDTDVRANFSNWGATTVDIGAPGVNIYSCQPGGSYQYMSGTSMASPHVCGAAALVLSVNPSLTYAEVKQILLMSADKKSQLEGLCVSGGRLNIQRAVLLAQGGDNLPPLPDPSTWLIKPTATGTGSIVMQASKATDKSGVEYQFDCIENNAFDRTWQSSPLYARSGYQPGTTYSFRVQSRDKSVNRNVTEWSETIVTTTATGTDTLAPAPNPTLWSAVPRVTRPSLNEIEMAAVTSYDENAVEYYFDCVLASNGVDPNTYDSGWRTSPIYKVIVSQVVGQEYAFTAYVRQRGTTDPSYVTAPAPVMKVGKAASSIIREVPSAVYRTIQDAIDAANNGDTVLVHPGVYREVNIDFRGKAITVRSENPENPAIVASTVIDCAEIEREWSWLQETRRAFVFRNMEGRNSVLAGLTIRNAAAIDEADEQEIYGLPDDPDQGDRYTGAEVWDGEDAVGGAILIGQYLVTWDIYPDPTPGSSKMIYDRHVTTTPSSPTIRNCVFRDCTANGEYGDLTSNAPGAPNDSDGIHGTRGLNGGNGYGGAIYAVDGSAPMLKECQFLNCHAVGGNGSNGSNGSNGGGHSDGVEEADGYRGGDGGDGGLGGCAWGGAVYFEPNCLPELYDVTVSDCYVQVGQPGQGGDGGDGSNAKTLGRGGHGGNGGLGGDLRAPDSSGGAIYFGENTQAIIEGCVFERCQVIAELTSDYSGGDGGNGADAAGNGQPGGNGGHGGPAYFVPDKMFELGGATATGGTGGAGGAGSDGGPGGNDGNDGYRHYGIDTGIFPSNMYYMSYYWEDTGNIVNPVADPNEQADFAFLWEWPTPDDMVVTITTPPAAPTPGAADIAIKVTGMFASPFSPYYGLVLLYENYTGIVVIEDPNNLGDPDYYVYDYSGMTPTGITFDKVLPLTPTNPEQPNAGACAGANFYGVNSRITMRDTRISYNKSFSNHGGGEVYDKGCRATFETCIFEGNATINSLAATDFKFEGYGGAIFADQPVSMAFSECQFLTNNAYCGAGLYCNFGPSDPSYKPELEIKDSIFTGNKADYHFVNSYGGAVYAGNSLHPYEEYYFNYLKDYRFDNTKDYLAKVYEQPGLDDFITFITSVYADEHGYVDFHELIATTLWNDELEADRVFDGQPLAYSVDVTGSTFEENLAVFGAGLYVDASEVELSNSRFELNSGHVGAGGFVYACDLTARNNEFAFNLGQEILSQGYLSEQDNSTVQVLSSAPGLYVSNCDSMIAGNRFAGNETDGYCGGLYVNGPSLSGYPQSVFNNLFVENTAALAGGALVADGGIDVEVLNCTFVENLVEDDDGYGGAIAAHDAYVSMTNCILWDNLAAWGPQLCVGDPLEHLQVYDPTYMPTTTVYADYSDIQGGEYDVYVDESGWPWLQYGYDNIEDNPDTLEVDEADPQFVSVMDPNDASERTFYLSEPVAGQIVTSPCVNTGTPSHYLYDPETGSFVAVSDVPAWLQEKLGFTITTRTDHVADDGRINMGYHYDASLPVREYTLEAKVYIADRFRHGELEVLTLTPFVDFGDPATTRLYKCKQGTIVQFNAVPDTDPEYRVQCWMGTDDDTSYELTNTVTMAGPRSVQVEFELAVPKKLYVPESHDTIEEALLAARSGDTIVLAPRPSSPYYITNPDGILFGYERGKPKDLVIQSADPNDWDVVASTIIDCQGSRYNSKRAFHFDGQTGATRIEGITIRNAFTAKIGLSEALYTGVWPWWDGYASWYTGNPVTAWTDITPPVPVRGWAGMDAVGDSYGGAMLCENGSSPVIYNCVFENCKVAGGIGGDGEDGYYPAGLSTSLDLDSQSGGHSGKGTGNGYGGAIALRSGSSPSILNCKFLNNQATGGWGGIPGDAGNSYNNGRYGWGGNDPAGLEWAYIHYGINLEAGYGEGDGHGGAIYVEKDCGPTIRNCQFEGNLARPGYVSAGGGEGAGNDYPQPFDGQTVGALGLEWGETGARVGRDGYLTTFGTTAGGALFFETNVQAVVEGCTFGQNQAYEVHWPDDAPVATRGGAIYNDPNVVLQVVPIRNENQEVTTRSEFTENLAGAIYCSTNVDLTVESTDFIDNTTTVAQDSTSSLFEVLENMQGSTIAYFDIAGGITLEQDANCPASITDCQFIGNTSHIGGAAVRTASDVDFVNCVLNSNKTTGHGGAVYGFAQVADPNNHTIALSFANCEMSGNDAKGFGGAVFAKNCLLTMDESFLVSNTGFSGGAVRLSYGNLTMHDCMFFGNTATGVATGSHRTVVEEGFGGAVHITDSPFVIEDTRFENNTAKGIIAAGGGLCVTGSQTYYHQSLKNCLFAQNASDSLGGAVACMQWVHLDPIENCTFADNTAEKGGALYIDNSSMANVTRSIFSKNSGIALYERTTGQTAVSYSLFNLNQDGDVYDGAAQITVAAGSVTTGYTNIVTGNPLFNEGPLGNYYLNQGASPAVDPFDGVGGYPTAAAVGLNVFTTDPSPTGTNDTGRVDLGYHYPNSSEIEQCDLTVTIGSMIDDQFVLQPLAGTVIPSSETYARGKVVDITADILGEYYLTGWSGGTLNDNSLEHTNKVLMMRDKNIGVLVRMRDTLYVGGSSQYDTLGDAIVAAEDGDKIVVAPGEYTSATQYVSGINEIILTGKRITISGYAPADDAVVRATIFRDYRFIFTDLDNSTVIEGITLNQSRMHLENANLTIRNCVFNACQFSDMTVVHIGTIPAGTDGYHQPPLFGGAMMLINSSPEIQNCTFEDNWIRGPDGENGYAGDASHHTGGDGGWPGGAYGGAVYCGLSSDPNFVHCTFTGNQVFGGNGGNGANGWVGGGVTWNGGRGGGWTYDPDVELELRTYWNGGWDGWTINSYGDKYGAWSMYALYLGDYDIDLWAKWFGWGDTYTSWDEFFADFLNDPYDPLGDPYDQMLDSWRYSGYGGAVYCEFDSNAQFHDCLFENNESYGGLTGVGGVIYLEQSWPDRQLDMPTAGGAVYAAWDSNLTFTGCTFHNNMADKVTVELPHTFNTSFGGAVAYENDCTVTFDECNIEDNDATVGGGIYGRNAVSTISDCNIASNEAYLGAGVYLEQDSAVVTGTIFRANSAKSPDPVEDPEGPGVPVASDSMQGMGAGLFAHLLEFSVKDSVFVDNMAQMSGGGLLLSGTIDQPSEIFNCLFVKNRARRDGGGVSLNWMSRADIRNCTFGHNMALPIENEFVGSGGGLYLATTSIADVNDSIFWGNEATEGTQITVGTGFEFDPQPSELTIAYTDIGTYPSANAIYKGARCTVNVGAGILAENPEFMTSPDKDPLAVQWQYYLDQQLSPCKDAGSRTSSDAGLSDYTTSVTGGRDKGVVDMGYHYLLSERSECGGIDEALVLSGLIDVDDLADFMEEWLTLDSCSEINGWCDGSDLNYDGTVDLEDMAQLTSCWLAEDGDIPYPSPVKWIVEPNATTGTWDTIDMRAEIVHDKWWPDAYIEYSFDCVQPTDPAYDSGWISSPAWSLSGLAPREYAYQVIARDGSHNETVRDDLLIRRVTPGDVALPAPQWQVLPYVTANNYVRMELYTYEELDTMLPEEYPDLPGGYEVYYRFDTGGGVSSGWQLEPVWVDQTVYTVNQVLTYYGKMQVSYNGSPSAGGVAVGDEVTVIAQLIFVPGDMNPPLPDPAEHTVTSPFQTDFGTGVYYHIVTAVTATDVDALGVVGPVNVNVEYKFVCVEEEGYSSGGSQDLYDIEWRNVDNVAGLRYPNNVLQVPQTYSARVGLPGLTYSWYIIVRDRSPNQNQTQPSVSKAVVP